MKVVLLKNVEKLGLAGAVRDVAEGYARNLLFPKKLAVPATAEALAKATQLRNEREHAAELDLERVEDLAKRLDGFEMEFKEKANSHGTLFAAITRTKIITVLKKKGIVVAEKHIVLPHPLKEIGEHDVVVALPHGLEAMIRVIITASG
ncbi:50S ribosomal protein L9 [Candidatus Uhrbacteria bacterium]|nr:50S ribosomal protein L9 [Candidatus Uhrbacteria bacterium]